MDSKLETNLPNELLLYKENVEATIKPYITIAAKATKRLQFWQSKFSGLPYFPKGLQYPIDSQGQAMFLLAQINFGETPKLELFPEKGILQFYIRGSDDLFGASFEDPADQTDFRVLYFSDVIEDETHLITDFHFLPEPEYLPIEKQSALTFRLNHAPMSVDDYQFESKILNLAGKSRHEYYQDNEQVYKQYGKLFDATGHKLGGYPFFTQTDPRENVSYQDNEYILLFQMDTDDKASIMWGDCGVANFFITQHDLQNRNFSNTFYNWDCC